MSLSFSVSAVEFIISGSSVVSLEIYVPWGIENGILGGGFKYLLGVRLDATNLDGDLAFLFGSGDFLSGIL